MDDRNSVAHKTNDHSKDRADQTADQVIQPAHKDLTPVPEQNLFDADDRFHSGRHAR